MVACRERLLANPPFLRFRRLLFLDIMPRRPANLTPRRLAESGMSDSFNSAAAPLKSKTSPLFSACLVFLGVIILLCYAFSNSTFHHSSKKDIGKSAREAHHGGAIKETFTEDIEDEEGDFSSRPECRTAVCQALPLLQEIYGETMNRVLYVGPSTCGVVLKLLKEGNVEAWGVQPSDPIPPVHSVCENLIRKGLIRVADVSQPLHYRSHSFSFVLASGVVDSMTSKQLNITLRELARVSSENIVLFINGRAVRRIQDPSGEKNEAVKLLKPRSKLWWQHRFQNIGLQESEEETKRFDSLKLEKSYSFNHHVFHLIPSGSNR